MLPRVNLTHLNKLYVYFLFPSCGGMHNTSTQLQIYCNGSVTNPIRVNPAFAAADITCATSS